PCRLASLLVMVVWSNRPLTAERPPRKPPARLRLREWLVRAALVGERPPPPITERLLLTVLPTSVSVPRSKTAPPSPFVVLSWSEIGRASRRETASLSMGAPLAGLMKLRGVGETGTAPSAAEPAARRPVAAV